MKFRKTVSSKRALKNLYRIYEVSEYEKDFAFKVVEAVLLQKKGYYIEFNQFVRIEECYLTVHKGSTRVLVCYQKKIQQLLEWLGVKCWVNPDERNKKKRFVRLMTEIKW